MSDARKTTEGCSNLRVGTSDVISIEEVFFEYVCNIFAINIYIASPGDVEKAAVGLFLTNMRFGLCERASESREFERVAQQMAVALAPQSAANLPSMHLALWLNFSRGRKKCREQIGRNSARESKCNLSCNFDSASRCHGVSVGVVRRWTIWH